MWGLIPRTMIRDCYMEPFIICFPRWNCPGYCHLNSADAFVWLTVVHDMGRSTPTRSSRGCPCLPSSTQFRTGRFHKLTDILLLPTPSITITITYDGIRVRIRSPVPVRSCIACRYGSDLCIKFKQYIEWRNPFVTFHITHAYLWNGCC